MPVENLIKAVLDANPLQRRKILSVLRGTDEPRVKRTERELRLVSIAGTARLLALGRNTVYRLIRNGRLHVVRLNGCPRVTMRSINEFLEVANDSGMKED